MNEESYTESATAAFLSNDIQRPPRDAPSTDGEDMILSGEYYLDAHRNEIICHQVWSDKNAAGNIKVIIWSNQGYGWIVGDPKNCAFTPEDARRCWNHAVDNGATRVYMRVKSKQSSKYDSVYEQWKSTSKYYNYDEDYKSYEELAKEDRVWENYALEA